MHPVFFSYLSPVYQKINFFNRSKSVGKEQLEVTDKKIFLYIGAAEALSQVAL